MVATVSALLIGLGTAYCLLLVRFAMGFSLVAKRWAARSVSSKQRSVSVIVAARNEAESIERCVNSILAVDYPRQLTEIVVVDDDSEDDTVQILRNLVETGAPIRVLSAPQEAGKTGKRNAIQHGISSSSGDIILLTDADSEVGQQWIQTMISAFEADTRFVAGPISYFGNDSWIADLIELEMLGLVSVGAGGIAFDRPNMCNGANIALTREAFEETGGYRDTDFLTSGDDELLMQKIAREHPGSVRFCPDPAAIVKTPIAGSVREFFEQRTRWASKGVFYPETRLIAMAVLVYAFNASLLLGLVLAIVSGLLWQILLLAVLLKCVGEAVLLGVACRHFSKEHLLAYLFPAQILIVPYIVVTGLAGLFGGFNWKGRQLKR